MRGLFGWTRIARRICGFANSAPARQTCARGRRTSTHLVQHVHNEDGHHEIKKAELEQSHGVVAPPLATCHVRRTAEIRMPLPTTERLMWHCGEHTAKLESRHTADSPAADPVLPKSAAFVA